MADIRATKDCFFQLIRATNLLDHTLGITEIKLQKQNETKNQTSDFIDPEEENGLDLSKLKTKRSDNEVALKFLDLVEKGEENIFLTGKA